MRRSVKICCFFAVFMWLVLAAGCTAKTEEQISFEKSDEEELQAHEGEDGGKKDTVKQQKNILYVDVCGQVLYPGVYELPGESRIYQAIEAAGGMTKEAATAGINQAQKLEDGQQVYVPSKEEMSSETNGISKGASAANPADDGKVSLNTATKEELMTLTGIGEARAEAIIRYREENSGFRSVEELKEIEGIKDGVFQKVKDQIRI